MSLRSRINSPEDNGSRGEDGHMVASYRAKLLEEIDLAEMSALAAAERRARLERVLGHIISREGPVLSTVERSQLIRRVVDEALGLGILDRCWRTRSITETGERPPGPAAVIVAFGLYTVGFVLIRRLSRIDV
ncbi:CpaF family protein OS=Streptomyces alboniger OX=132473 GN=CP975_22450 PE=3 SV=1 [Streptomyces alboniger]